MNNSVTVLLTKRAFYVGLAPAPLPPCLYHRRMPPHTLPDVDVAFGFQPYTHFRTCPGRLDPTCRRFAVGWLPQPSAPPLGTPLATDCSLQHRNTPALTLPHQQRYRQTPDIPPAMALTWLMNDLTYAACRYCQLPRAQLTDGCLGVPDMHSTGNLAGRIAGQPGHRIHPRRWRFPNAERMLPI